ncbi:MAG: C25 family cysteine peptidase, partial [Euryarchaeota archaeon]|nr:C25 family cysteine peptidase [Euryarchaeota archaeon]
KVAGDVLLDSIGGPRILYQLLARYTPIPGLLFRTPLGNVGQYSVREVSNTEMGPSVMMVEGCGSGKIDGFLPTNSLANAYLHAGVNAYISPTTFSAFYGALEPRFGSKGVGFGIAGFLKAWSDLKKGVYVPVYFNQYIFEHANLEMFHKNIDIGTALRNAKNAFLPAQINITFRWTPPLSIIDNLPYDLQQQINDNIKSTAEEDLTFHVEKYCTIYQINLLGDPAFNPYEPCNEGK